MSSHFLRLAENAAGLLVRQKNTLTVVSSGEITPDQYFRRTRWSDHTVGVAILFNFFHGTELVLKGGIALAAKPPAHHRLSELLTQFEPFATNTALLGTLRQYVRDVEPGSPLGKFLQANSINIDSWYQALKYPTSAQGKRYSHVKLQYDSTNTLSFWRSIRRGAESIRKQAVAFYNDAAPPTQRGV